MVASMQASPAEHHQHPSRQGPPADRRQYASGFKAGKRDSNPYGSYAIVLSPEESSNSWEAQAFAEDASSLGAGIWPPRAYSCSFCRREFGSAQALGGHMNVHRRDRARLRQPSPPAPFHNLHRQPASIIHKPRYDYSSISLHPRACPEIYPNDSLSTQSSTAAMYTSDIAAFYPQLHPLASKAASTLMASQGESSDRLSLWPPSTDDCGNGCGSTIVVPSRSVSSSLSSSTLPALSREAAPSIGAAPCRCASHCADNMQLEDVSPVKKTSNSESQPYQVLKLTMDDGVSQAQDKQNLRIKNVDESRRIQYAREACSEFIDLELRLGR